MEPFFVLATRTVRMRDNVLIEFIVSSLRELTSPRVFENYNNNINSEENLLPESEIERKRRLLRGFDENDNIYEQFHCTNPEEQDEETIFHNNWKTSREPGAIWLFNCFVQSFTIVVLCCLLVSALSVLIMYVDINTADICFKVQWDELPEKVKRARSCSSVGRLFFTILSYQCDDLCFRF